MTTTAITTTAQVYYGFSDNFLKWGKDNVVRFEEWMGDMNRLLNQEGILYKGGLIDSGQMQTYITCYTPIMYGVESY